MLGHILTVMRGTVIAQAIGILVLPILTRVYAPEAFGHLQLLQSLLLVLIVVPSLRYDIAILRASDETEVPSLVRLCLLTSVATAVVVAVVLALLPFLAAAPFAIDLPFSPLMVAVGMAASGFAQVLLYVSMRHENFALNARARIIQALVYAGIALAIGFLHLSELGIVYADFISRLALCGFLVWLMRRTVATRSQWDKIKRVAHRYREYPLFALPGGIINSLGGALTPILIYSAFDAHAAGQFGLVERAISLPVSLVATSVAQVFTAQLGRLTREGVDARRYFHRLLGWLLVVGAGPVLALSLFAPSLFVVVFGEEWRMSGDLARFMAPAYLIILLSSSVNMTLTVAGYQKMQVTWEIARLAAMAMLWWLVPRLQLDVGEVVMVHAAILAMAGIVFLILCDLALRRSAPSPERM